MGYEDAVDPEDFYADLDRRARERRERRTGRRRRLPRPPRVPLGDAFHEARHLARTPAGRVLVGAVAAIALFTAIGLIALWPGGTAHHGPSQAFGGPTQRVDVQTARTIPCQGPVRQDCRQIVVTVDGKPQPITLGPATAVPAISAGTTVRVSEVQAQPGVTLPAGAERYQFVGLDREGPLWVLVLALGVLALVLLRLRGLLAVLGVGLSLLLVVAFIVPAILAGSSGLLVALVGALAVMFVTLTLTNGLGAQTMAAALGISATLLLTCGLAAACVGFAHLDGTSNDVSLYLQQQNRSLSLEGVVLAGIVIGALGVLADTAVTQASAVMALRRANPSLTARGLYGGAITVGRDHLSATIHTLVLAYAGATLPLLLAMRSSGVAFGDAINAQDLAEPVVATVIGCVALLAAVPLTTGLASLLVARIPVADVPDGHGHHHH
jgi:uncharacterized membrane protein